MSNWLSRGRDPDYEAQIMWALVAALERAVADAPVGDAAARQEVGAALVSLRQQVRGDPLRWAERLALSLVQLTFVLRDTEAAVAELPAIRAERDRLQRQLANWLADPLQERVCTLQAACERSEAEAAALRTAAHNWERLSADLARRHAAEVAQLQAEIADLSIIVGRLQLGTAPALPDSAK